MSTQQRCGAALSPGDGDTRERVDEQRVFVGVYGGLRVEHGGAEVPIGGARQRRLLLSLLAGRGAVVPMDQLIAAVWFGEQFPEHHRRSLRTYVSRLRRTIGPDMVKAQYGGYRLDADAIETDIGRLVDDAAEARRLHAEGFVLDAIALLEHALARCDGPPMPEFGEESWLHFERQRAVELRLGVMEDRFGMAVETDALTPTAMEQLEAVARLHPERERLQFLRVDALYRSGRQVHALRAVDDVRAAVAERGLTLSPEIRELESRILRHEEHRPVLSGARPAAGRRPVDGVVPPRPNSILLALTDSIRAANRLTQHSLRRR